jgi:hypothetical protein
MPDISMCVLSLDQCSLAGTCYRNAESGTVPSEHHQSYLVIEPPPKNESGDTENCYYYWPWSRKIVVRT